MRRLWGAIATAAALAACAPAAPPLPDAPMAAGAAITVAATPVPLNHEAPSQDRIGDFAYAGGVVLSAADTARFHGLSDMHVGADGRLIAVSDEGDLLFGRLTFDGSGRLTGLADATLTVLAGPDGKPLQGKQEADAEGLAILPNGDRLVSFEQHHRILLYPAAGGPPRLVLSPSATFPLNGGMEALAHDPDAGQDAYLTAGEDSGETWTCRVSRACVQGPTITKPREFGVVAVRRFSGGRTAWLLRAWDPLRGNRVTLAIHDRRGEIARLDLARPLTIDNFEALAVTPAKGGAIRFYLLSDDNFQSSQRTLLLAFDWTPVRQP